MSRAAGFPRSLYWHVEEGCHRPLVSGVGSPLRGSGGGGDFCPPEGGGTAGSPKPQTLLFLHAMCLVPAEENSSCVSSL